jgi:hypothetical protein
MKVKFFGSATTINGVAMQSLGQELTLADEATARAAARSGAAILPSVMFDEVNLTPEEVINYPKPSDVFNAPVEFRDKIQMLKMLQAQWLI